MKYFILLLAQHAASSTYHETETPSDRMIREKMDKLEDLLGDLKDKIITTLRITPVTSTSTTVPPAEDQWVLIAGNYSDHLGLD